jgi:hypothetical protein
MRQTAQFSVDVADLKIAVHNRRACIYLEVAKKTDTRFFALHNPHFAGLDAERSKHRMIARELFVEHSLFQL